MSKTDFQNGFALGMASGGVVEVVPEELLATKQDALVSGENIKTINGQSILGEGDISISGGSDYTLPVGGEELGGVKNGGNVVINEDGTMTAPASGGSEEKWEHICDISVVEDTENPIFQISQDLGARYKKLRIFIDKNSPNGIVGSAGDTMPFRIYANGLDNNNIIATFGQGAVSSGWSVYLAEIEYNQDLQMITGFSSVGSTLGANAFLKTVNTKTRNSISNLIFYNNAPVNATAGFRTFTINVYGVKA